MRLPDNTQRLLIVGRTGSGKSRAAVWHLGMRDWEIHPWIILDYKGEKLFTQLPDAKYVGLDYTPNPKKGGVFIYRPVPERDDDEVEALLWRIHAAENIGVYVDEGYMLDINSHAMAAIFTQGRSKHIPLIMLSQRPTRISRFAVSEADFYQLFELNDKRDRESVNKFIPFDLELVMRQNALQAKLLPDYNSLYFDVSGNKLEIITAVPNDREIIQMFADKKPVTRTKTLLI